MAGPDDRTAHTTQGGRDAVRDAWRDHHLQVVAARRASSAAAPAVRDSTATVGVCCSGGGIRSAAFNLGALQALERTERLQTADYLAAVSGGAYIAGAMSLVQFRGDDEPDPDPGFATTAPYAAGSPELRHLRRNSSYLAPDLRGRLRLLGYLLFGAGSQLVLLALALLVVAGLTAIVGQAFAPELHPQGVGAPLAGVRGWLLAAGGLLAAASLLSGLYGLGRHIGPRGRHARSAARWLGWTGVAVVILVGVLPSVVAALARAAAAFTATDAPDAITRVLAALTAAGVPTVVVSAIRLVGRQVTGHLDGTSGGERTQTSGIGARIPEWSSWAAYLITPLVLTSAFLLLYVLAVRGGLLLTVTSVMVGVVGLGAYDQWIDPNRTSMHSFYRERLNDGFAVQRAARGGYLPWPYDRATTLSASRDAIARSGRPWPRLLVCAAANVTELGSTPTGRNAVPLVFSDDWLGGDELGWVRTSDYESALQPRGEGEPSYPATLPSLLGAMAMSGAALSPSMGKMTSRPYQLLLGLANARLGVWLPNPRRTGGPGSLSDRPRVRNAVDELRGRAGLDQPFVYVTDGGHYENLGLLELMRRRCTEIWCFDASGDEPESFTTLAQALAMARTDLDVDITDVRPVPLRDGDRRTPEPGSRLLADRSWLVTDFAYVEPDGTRTEGVLVYVKCRVTADAPWDVRSLYERDPQFPNHSTADQLYGEERFEAYRMLGDHLATCAIAEFEGAGPPTGVAAGAAPPAAAPSASHGSAAVAPARAARPDNGDAPHATG